MATNTKNKEWAKTHEDMLVKMYKDGYIALEDIKAINNKDDAYSIDEQDAAFERVKNNIQNRYSEERLNSDDVKSVRTEDEIKQLRTFRESVDKFDKPTDALLSSKLIQSIKSSGYKDVPLLKGMTEQIKGMSDKDLKEYIYNQRAYLNQALSDKMVKSIDGLQEYLTIPPEYGEKRTNYDEMFKEKDILDKMDQLSYRDIDFVARKNGMTGKELIHDMTNAKIARDRENIAHGRWRKDASIPENIVNEIGGTALTLFGRRQQEAIARGEDPALKDYAGDIGEQVAYAAPLGRIARPISTLAKAGYGLGTAAAVPHISELYDAIVYDDENNPRSNFSEVDALMGTGVNVAAPALIRGVGKRIGQYTSPKITKAWGELAEGKSADDVINEVKKKYKPAKIQNADNPDVPGDVRKEAQDWKSVVAADKALEEALTAREPLVYKIAREKGNNLGEKANNYVKKKYPQGGYTMLGVSDEANGPTPERLYDMVTKSGLESNPELTDAVNGLGRFVPEVRARYEANPNVVSTRLMNVYDKLGLSEAEKVKSAKQLLIEDALKNYLTNQFGEFTYGDENVNLPFLYLTNNFGIDVNEKLKEHRKEQKREKAKEESKERLPNLQRIYGNLK